MQERFTLSVDKRKIRGVFHCPLSCDFPPVVITCHGLFSSKESDKFLLISKRFTQEGLAVVRFDFSGCGESDGCISDTTVSRRLKELEAVVVFARSHPKTDSKLGILGSSLGGFVSLFFASKHPVNALSVWATPYDLDEARKNMPEEDLDVLKEGFFADARSYDLGAVLSGIDTVQVIQGKKDTVVPYRHSKEIFRRVKNPKELKVFPDGDHTISSYNDRGRAVRLSLDWFKKHLVHS